MLSPQERDFQIAEARLNELKYALPLVEKGRAIELDARKARLNRDLADAHELELAIPESRAVHLEVSARQRIQDPPAGHGSGHDRHDGQGLLSLFLQDVLVSDLTQLTIFDIRNQFFRRTMALDLSNFNDQGSAELARPVHQRHGIGPARIDDDPGPGDPRAAPDRQLSDRRPAVQLAAHLPGPGFGADLGLLHPPSRQDHEAGGPEVARKHVQYLQDSSGESARDQGRQGVHDGTLRASPLLPRDQEPVQEERSSRDDRRPVRPRSRDSLALSTVSIALLSGAYLVLYHTMAIDFGLFKLQLASSPIEIEDLLALYAMLGGISDPVRKLANVHSKVQRAAAAADRICTLMDRRPEVADKPKAIRLHRHKAAIEFEDVHFSYNGRDPVLRGLNLEVRHGETIALVGPNGCGKSTLMNLLPRFWDVQAGAIRVDGHDLRDVQIRTLRSQIGMVIQETTLFHDTVANNIAYGTRHASRDSIVSAAKKSYAHQFIMNLPNGYDTMLGEIGTGLSGGQRQRLALARAMLRDPAILILDEATSAVDIQDEALIRKAIEEFSRSRTTFLITHSLGALSFADRIVLLNDGQIEAVGTDSELRRGTRRSIGRCTRSSITARAPEPGSCPNPDG